MNYNLSTFSAPSVVCIGGGTGLSTMLRGLKKRTRNITAVVTVTDDGGGSGVLRDELGMLPPGDIRNCLQALANIEPTMSRLLSYRFTTGSLKGQSFGNLFLAAMNGISGSFDEAVSKMGEVLAITGRVLPVTNDPVWLRAIFEDGTEVFGESNISEAKRTRPPGCRIQSVELVPPGARSLEAILRAIADADMILLGPGSLYTSIIPNLLVDGVAEAIECSAAVKIYICNVMTQQGETEGYSVYDHVAALMAHAGRRRIFDTCLVNSVRPNGETLNRYRQDGAGEIPLEMKQLSAMGIDVIHAPLVSEQGLYFRHDPDLLAAEVMRIFEKKRAEAGAVPHRDGG